MCICKCEGCLGEEHNPEECTAEQIKACHGDTIEHSCISGGK